ncbi:hypothetical protein PCL_08373 [Purpureocillium lilacinum]|uniref:PNPLA domain-containing protein n=1 Tax=Purpureocillium lilacinum TaxID=33203 RepID=A0A2U3DRZ8_PURLI|nr:hypothetical protein PCL_08373 [Purpureocillium lilacinum]
MASYRQGKYLSCPPVSDYGPAFPLRAAAMSSCKHTDWLRLWQNGSRAGLEITDRPRRLLGDIKNADNQAPSFLVLIGNRSKQVAMTRLRIGNARLCSRRGHADFHLFLSSAREFKDKPLVIADGDIPLHHRLPIACRTPRCHEITASELAPAAIRGDVADMADNVLHRSLLPIADVVLLFTQDLGGVEFSMRRVNAWLKKGAASCSRAQPRLVLVVAKEEQSHALLAIRDSMRKMDLRATCFEDISVLCMPDGAARCTRQNSGPVANWEILRHKLFTSLELSRQTRKRSALLFSARHFADLLQYGAFCITDSPWTPFDFVKASRRHNGVSPQLAAHLLTLIRQFSSREKVKAVVVPLVASSFVLDQYPPEMHEFNPRIVFEAMYKEHCIQAGVTANADHEIRELLPADFVSLIEEHMVEQFEDFRRLGSAVAAHRAQLLRLRHALEEIASEDTCLCCLQRRPQTGLRCRHSLCHVCVTLFNRRDEADETLVHIERCVLCSEVMEGLPIREHPQTATVRVLSLDGGGARGIAEIESLMELQRRINLPYPVIKNFDVCFATSCGVGILLRLCDGWDIQSCKEYFKESARRAFEPRPLQKLFRNVPWVRKLVLGCSLLLLNSKYPTDNLDSLLRDEYGATRTIMDHSKAKESGIKLGITLTSVGDTKAYIATNYNGVGQDRVPADYEVLRPNLGLRKIPLWELVRCAIAAPFYFTPRRIEKVGTFQDGGLTFFNNPASIAMQESSALYPTKGEPSIVASFGTGFAKPSAGTSIVGRLLGAFEILTSSKIRWKQLLSHRRVGERSEFFRFDVEFQSAAPALDDVDRMDEISEIAKEAVAESSTVERLAKHLRAELFYFELDGHHPLRYMNGAFSCIGHIICRLRPGTTGFHEFMEQLHDSAATFCLDGRTLPINIAESMNVAHGAVFRQRVTFRVRSRHEKFGVKLDEGLGGCNISGSPFTLNWLLREQQLDANFGTVDHRKRKHRDDDACMSSKAKRRRKR